tara:strand:+ start:142 stop:1932 length:1791 start_codon:yes stop_codon:yes gene_type:complete
MNNNPLQRRMFAQQLMNRHNMANQPMGILASSPQLMGAVQGLANGGMVKGYNRGGSSYGPFPAPESLETYFDPGQNIYSDGRVVRDGGGGSLLYNLAGKNKREEIDEQEIKAAREYYTKKTYDDAQNLKNQIEPGDRVKSTNEADEFNMTTNKKNTTKEGSFSEDTTGNTTGTGDGLDYKYRPGLSNKEILDDGAVGNVINNENEKGNNKNNNQKDDQKPGKLNSEFKASVDKKLKVYQDMIDNPKSAPKLTIDYVARIKKLETLASKKGEELKISDFDEEARKISGIDETNYDEQKHTAFWMSLIKGGLATAAGESSNALTNIAKGLGFGVNSYAKDTANINEQEREDNKELANIRYKLLTDKRSADLAQRTLELQYNTSLLQIEQNQGQFESTQAFQEERAKVQDAYRGLTFETNLMKTMSDMGFQQKTMELNQSKFEQDKINSENLEVRWNKTMNAKISQGITSEESVKVLTMGDKYATFDKEAFEAGKGGIKLTPLGAEVNYMLASGKFKGRLTDLMQHVTDAEKNSEFKGIKFVSPAAARSAALSWFSGPDGLYERAKADVVEGTDVITNSNLILNNWKKGLTGKAAINLE